MPEKREPQPWSILTYCLQAALPAESADLVLPVVEELLRRSQLLEEENRQLRRLLKLPKNGSLMRG
jgi:hypothetical protein